MDRKHKHNVKRNSPLFYVETVNGKNGTLGTFSP